MKKAPAYVRSHYCIVEAYNDVVGNPASVCSPMPNGTVSRLAYSIWPAASKRTRCRQDRDKAAQLMPFRTPICDRLIRWFDSPLEIGVGPPFPRPGRSGERGNPRHRPFPHAGGKSRPVPDECTANRLGVLDYRCKGPCCRHFPNNGLP